MSTHETIQAAGGVVYRITPSGKVRLLLIKKRGGFWSLPKGRINANESAEEAAIREIQEETGIIGEVEDLLGVTMYGVEHKKSPHQKEVVYYLVRANGGTLQAQQSEEIVKLRWISVEQALQRIRRPRLRAIIIAAALLLNTSCLPHEMNISDE